MEIDKEYARGLYARYKDEKKELQNKYNKELLDVFPIYPYFNEGDIVRVKQRKYDYDSFKHRPGSDVYKITKVIPPDMFRNNALTRSMDLHYSYIGQQLLSSYNFSKIENEISIHKSDQIERFLGGNKITRGNDTIESWEACNVSEINFIMLCRDVENILNKMNNEKVCEQLSRYSKQLCISKDSLANNPELFYIHEKIEILKKFQTHIKTNH